MEGREKRIATSQEVSTSQQSKRTKQEEEENWTTVSMSHSGAPQSAPSTLQRDATTSYATNRETKYHKNARTIEETHLIQSKGSSNQGFSEEHWTSEIKSYITTQPPKFIQVIKAFRVLATDTLTLVVEVDSDPPAIFEWFCNDRPVTQDKRRFKVRHGINITTLTVEGPEQGVYKCTARNPAGISTTYGYIIVNAPPQYKKWVEQKQAIVYEEKIEISEQIGITVRQAPRFVNQVPNLTLKPGAEAVIDVEVESSPPAKFSWFVNGFEFIDTSGRVELYHPKPNRCVARFTIPQTGEYKVIAENDVGKDQSIGYIDIKKEAPAHQIQRPPLPSDQVRHIGATAAQRHHDLFESTDVGRAASVTKTYNLFESSSYDQRSMSLPRPVRSVERQVEMSTSTNLLKRHQEELEMRPPHTSMNEIYRCVEREDGSTETLYRSVADSSPFRPQAPNFTTILPESVRLSTEDKLILSVDVNAVPQADIHWHVDGKEIKQSSEVNVLNEHNRSTLVVQPPVPQGYYTATALNEAGTKNCSTAVHRVEEESFEQVDEQTILRELAMPRGRSSPPEIVQNAITVTKAHDGWEMVEEGDVMQSSNESFETVRFADTARSLSRSVGRDLDQTPQPRVAPSMQTSSFTERISEQFGGVSTDTTKTMRTMAQSSLQTEARSSKKTELYAVEEIEERRQVIAPRKISEALPKRPFVLEQPAPEVRVKAGEKLVLYSKVDSYPESSFKWYMNNFEVRPSSKVHIESAFNESRATFHKPTDGTYKVIANNIHGTCSSSTRVITEVFEESSEESSVSIVRLPQPPPPVQQFQLVRKQRFETRKDLPSIPKMTKTFASLIRVPQNEPLQLQVETEAIPPARFTWRVNNFEVRPSATVHIEQPAPNASRATFTRPTEGRYEVIAANDLGTDTCATKVVVEYESDISETKITAASPPVPPKPSIPPSFIQPLTAETILDEDTKEFSLEVLVDATRPVAFRWFADGSLLSNTVQNQMTNEAFSSTLVVRKPVLKPMNYAVEASNTNGAVWSETRVLPYTVTKTSTTVEEAFSTEAVTERRQRAPRFIRPLESVELNEGDRFTTTVKVDSDGAPCEFLWYLNGRDMRMMPGFRVHSTHSESTLTVDSTTVKNNGKLSVVAKNKYGSAESSSTVSIFKIEETYEIISSKVSVPSDNAPRVMSPLHSSVFKPGEQLTLRCRIDAAPPAQVTWSKDEIDLAEWVINEDITTSVLPDGTYELSKPTCTVQDAGIYQCTARNAHGKAETAAYVSVEEILYTTDVHETQMHEVSVTKSPSPYVPQVPPHFVEPMTAHDEDTSTVLTCKVHSEAPVEISWYRDDIQLQQTDKHVMQSLVNGMQTLTINNVNRRDEGLYNCRAESRYGVAETTSRVATTRQTHSVEEVLIEEHNDEQIQLPQRMEFQKKVYSDTSVKLVSETEVTESEEHYSRTAELRKAEEEYKLLVKVADTVARRLVANLVVSEAVKEAVHRIREDVRTSDEEEIFFETTVVEERFHAPRFETNIECYNVRVGEVVHLATDISAHPQPTVDWYFGQQKIQQSGRTEVQYSNGRSTLVIKNARKEDEGTYICCAENRAGRSVLSCELRVIDTTSDRTETTVDFSRTTKYISTETEAEVFSNVHVNHAEETFEHHIAFIQPRTIALGYDCRASTSKVCDDSVIIRREETEMLLVKSLHELEAREKEVTLNVNVERPTPQFTHDVRILQSREEDTSFMSTEEWLVRSEEVMQTTDITLTEKQVRSHGKQSTVNTCATVVIEKPQQKAIHEVKCLYDERIRLPTERFHAVTSVDIRQVQVVNELFHSVMTRKDDHLAHEVANVEVRRPAAQFDHMTTVVESEIAHASINLTAPLRARSEIILAEVNLGRYNQSMSSEISLITRPVRRATAEQRIVILEGLTTIFSEEVIWSLKKINKSRTQLGEPVTTANVEVMKPPERGDHVVNIIDTQKIVHEILAVAAAATKYKITNVFITLTKKGETAHQALVIEYESYVEDEASLSVAVITAPAFHSKQEEIWTRETHVREVYDRRNIVDVFVEVDANCPDQSVELVASVNLPTVTEANLQNVKWWETSQIVETSISISESSSMGILQAPKFFKKLENVTSVMGRSLQFKCIVGGMPMPEIRWYVDGDEIHSTTEYETLYEDGVCILRFRELVIEDEGEYTCEATNPAGRAVTKCFLHTKGIVDETVVPTGSSASIHCETITKEYTLNWQKDRQPLPLDQRYQYSDSTSGHEHSLTIHGVRRSDEGEYGVVVEESYTAVQRITVVDTDYQMERDEEATVAQYITLPQQHREQQRETFHYDRYQVCSLDEFFDFRLRTETVMVPVVVQEPRLASVALSCDSSASRRVAETNTEYEFNQWQKAVQEIVITELVHIKTALVLSIADIEYDTSITCAPLYGRVTMVETTIAPTPQASVSIQLAHHFVDVDLFRATTTTTNGMSTSSCVEITRTLPRLKSGPQLSVCSASSERVEFNASIECSAQVQHVSVVFVARPGWSELNTQAVAYSHAELSTEFSAYTVSAMDVMAVRRFPNETYTWMRVVASKCEDSDNVVILEQPAAEESLQALVKQLPEPLFVMVSDHIALINLSQWMDSTVVREVSFPIVMRLARKHEEYMSLHATTSEEDTLNVVYQRRPPSQGTQICLIQRPPPLTANVTDNFAREDVTFILDSAVIRQTESSFVAKLVSRAYEWMRMNASTLEEGKFDIFMDRQSSGEDAGMSLISRPPPQNARLMSNIEYQELSYSLDSFTDEGVIANILVKVMTRALTSMRLHATSLEEGYFGVLMLRRPEHDQLYLRIIEPLPILTAEVYAGFATQMCKLSLDCRVVREIESHFIAKARNITSTVMSMRASTLEESQCQFSLDSRVVREIDSPFIAKARNTTSTFMSMRASTLEESQCQFSLDCRVVREIESPFIAKARNTTSTLMSMRASTLEESLSDIVMGRRGHQELTRVTVVSQPPPENATIINDISWRQSEYMFATSEEQSVENKFMLKLVALAFTSMKLRGISLEEGDFGVYMFQNSETIDTSVLIVVRPLPVLARVMASIEDREDSYSFDSFVDQQVEFNMRVRMKTLAFTSMKLHATTLEEGDYIAWLGCTPQEDHVVIWITQYPCETARVRSNIESQEMSFSLDSFVDQRVEKNVRIKMMTAAFTSMKLQAVTIEEGDFCILMDRCLEGEMINVTVVAPPGMITERTHAGFERQHIHYLFGSAEEQGIQLHFSPKHVHTARLSCSLLASTLERREMSTSSRRSLHEEEQYRSSHTIDSSAFTAESEREEGHQTSRAFQSSTFIAGLGGEEVCRASRVTDSSVFREELEREERHQASGAYQSSVFLDERGVEAHRASRVTGSSVFREESEVGNGHHTSMTFQSSTSIGGSGEDEVYRASRITDSSLFQQESERGEGHHTSMTFQSSTSIAGSGSEEVHTSSRMTDSSVLKAESGGEQDHRTSRASERSMLGAEAETIWKEGDSSLESSIRHRAEHGESHLFQDRMSELLSSGGEAIIQEEDGFTTIRRLEHGAVRISGFSHGSLMEERTRSHAVVQEQTQMHTQSSSSVSEVCVVSREVDLSRTSRGEECITLVKEIFSDEGSQ